MSTIISLTFDLWSIHETDQTNSTASGAHKVLVRCRLLKTFSSAIGFNSIHLTICISIYSDILITWTSHIRATSTMYNLAQEVNTRRNITKKSVIKCSEIFPKQLIIFNQDFTCLVYVHMCSKLQNFIQLSLNLTKLCHIKHNHPVNFHFSLEFLLLTSQRMNGH